MFYVTYDSGNLLPVVLLLASIERLLISSPDIHMRLYSSGRLVHLLIYNTSIVLLAAFQYSFWDQGGSETGCLLLFCLLVRSFYVIFRL